MQQKKKERRIKLNNSIPFAQFFLCCLGVCIARIEQSLKEKSSLLYMLTVSFVQTVNFFSSLFYLNFSLLTNEFPLYESNYIQFTSPIMYFGASQTHCCVATFSTLSRSDRIE
jgi:hypothetical protein